VTFSEEAYRIFGFERDSPVTLEEIGRRIHPDDRHVLPEKVTAARTAGEGQDYEIRLLMPNGSVKYLHTTSSEIQDTSGRRQYIGALQDVTQRRLAEEALNTARSELAHVSRVTALSALTASIAHEINQPLSGIITNAGTCLRMLDVDPPNVDGARETARRAIRDGNRASDVIARLRALFSHKEFTPESIDLNDATREVIALSLNDLQRNRVIVQSELTNGAALVTGDRIQLQQVILNLLRNASDAMADVQDRPRQLLIRTDREGNGCVRLTVRDTGVGLGGQNMDKPFDSFYTTKSGGMGIGLSVSRAIIERHRGRLWAEHHDGPGATFAFSIPGGPEGVAHEAPAT
jgi:PAS domain S-box-containing protein